MSSKEDFMRYVKNCLEEKEKIKLQGQKDANEHYYQNSVRIKKRTGIY